MGAHGISFRPRDLAKLGQLVLDRGAWGGTQIVSSAWVDQSTSWQTDSDHSADPLRLDYGFFWWTIPGEGAFTAWGHGGQFILVVPDHRLVLVQIALPDTDSLHGSQVADVVELTRGLWRSAP